jgi:hypothetical protein
LRLRGIRYNGLSWDRSGMGWSVEKREGFENCLFPYLLLKRKKVKKKKVKRGLRERNGSSFLYRLILDG